MISHLSGHPLPPLGEAPVARPSPAARRPALLLLASLLAIPAGVLAHPTGSYVLTHHIVDRYYDVVSVPAPSIYPHGRNPPTSSDDPNGGTPP